ncbi:Os07g0526150, partial [Oryza sativa Japonica Group]
MVSMVKPGPNPSVTPHSAPSPSSSIRRRCSSSTKISVLPSMLPYSLRTLRVAASFPGFSWRALSMWSKINGLPGCTAQKRSFHSPPSRPSGVSASERHFLTLFAARGASSLASMLPSRPCSVSCMVMTCSVPGMSVCEAETISNIGCSTGRTASAPTMTAPAPSPNSAWQLTVWGQSGPRKVRTVSSTQETRTRAPRLFSARSLARRSAAAPAEQPLRWIMVRRTVGRRPRSAAKRTSAPGAWAPALVVTMRWVMSVAGRPHCTMALAAAVAASSGTAAAAISRRASSDGFARSRNSGCALIISSVWWKKRFSLP